MNKNAIKKYAVWARRELIDRVSKKAMRYGIAPEIPADPEADSVEGRLLSDTEKKERRALIEKVAAHGYEQTMEEAAYTWFNRFAALRFMEVNGYLPSHVRVFTNDAGEFKPQILAEAIHLDLPGLDKEKVYALKEGNDEEALFRYLIIVQCNALNEILPGMFQRLEDFTELLLPDNLLREGSVIERLVKQGDAGSIPEEDWRDQVQIIGWLYQYYNTALNELVYDGNLSKEKIPKHLLPAATTIYTPDWIVRYMVENSLGRLWLEGHPNENLQGEWKYYLPEAEQEESVQKQLAEMRKESANRKPEDIRCIDPCMGSGHILCYMFDVLVKIYEDYGYTAREAAASIVQNNLYGLDIDDRAAQLSYFAVMMKARQYDRRFFSRGIQPNVMAIEESNGLATWAETAGDSLVSGQLTFEDDFIRMADYLIEIFQDAKEYGSILTVQADRYDALVDFIEKTGQETGNLLFRAWIDEVERRILPLIQQAKVFSQKYDVIVTNPPYLGSTRFSFKLNEYVKKYFPNEKSDLSMVMLKKSLQETAKTNGYVAFVTTASWMSLSSFEKLRSYMYKDCAIDTLVDCGTELFEGKVGHNSIVSWVVRKTKFNYRMTAVRLVDYCYSRRDEKEVEFFNKKNYFVATQENFSKIPGSPVAYWVSEAMLRCFGEKCIKDYGFAGIGMRTGDNERFLRLWYEVSANNFSITSKGVIKWIPYNKGGNFRKWYGNNEYVVNWENDGEEIKDNTRLNYPELGDNLGWKISNEKYYFKPGITWTGVTMAKFSCRIYPSGFIFDSGANGLFPYKKQDESYLAGFLNTKIANDILRIINPTINTGSGTVKSIPVIKSKTQQKKVDELTNQNISISRADWDAFETSWDFQSHPLAPTAYERREQLSYGIHSAERKKSVSLLTDRYAYWEQACNDRFSALKENEEELNRIFIDIYGLADELTPEVEDKDVTVRRADLPRDIRSLISYAVGCMFGRYSLDTPGLVYAGGEWDDSKYRTFLPDEDAIIPICDDEYFDDDIVGRFVEFIATVFGKETLEENLQFIADALGGRGSSREVIRSYFLTGFYADHVKTYQKRPIYWLFDSGKKNGFKCLVYMHRYCPDTIARIRTDYVHEQQSRYRTAIESLEQARDNAATAGDKVKAGKKLAAVEAQAKELLEYEEKIHHLADQMIAIDLDDGVKHNYAIFQDVLAKIK
ncbi:BREX-1 system adenine-specific DNA-methyltransferase PglX [Selenomonas sputigena]|uniref:site-specific DNA-methyltransferase (adenine-specific) n=1 Tax=Selenomonas sputigena (strain ATCC 35185 / DSM 20758 / CCUG 44933 / VPI D19B-28) TaxID=546271 RepID=F4EZD9_SELS3|nr:BREX-1 system adenine-specific DNA-methyltransferase PglX [Selenomonas sputigena]AEB99696.1 N-6 DNA methylase [Selenomonas sputigena ATCC 35185]